MITKYDEDGLTYTMLEGYGCISIEEIIFENVIKDILDNMMSGEPIFIDGWETLYENQTGR